MSRSSWATWALLFLIALTSRALAHKPSAADPAAAVDLFAAEQAGQIAVKFVPENEAKGTVVITNASGRPLTIRLPDAFAGMPVLAQFGPGNGNPLTGANNTAPGGGTQQLSGTFGPSSNTNNPLAPGIFSIAPEQVTKLKVTSVCLEFGKQAPYSRVPYRLAPLAEATSDGRVAGLMRALKAGQIDQPAAQAAAWHLANSLSWDDLRRMGGRRHLGGVREPRFSEAQLARAMAVVERLTSAGEVAADSRRAVAGY